MKVFSVAYRIRSFCLLSEDLQHSGSNSSVTQRASVSRAEHEIDSDGSSRKHGDDDSDSNSDNHTSEHDDGDSDGDGDVVHNSDLGEAQMNTCGMYKNRDLCPCVYCVVTFQLTHSQQRASFFTLFQLMFTAPL